MKMEKRIKQVIKNRPVDDELWYQYEVVIPRIEKEMTEKEG